MRDKHGHPYITYCFVYEGGTYARGMAVCSKSENAVKKLGKEISYGRAKKAWEEGINRQALTYQGDKNKKKNPAGKFMHYVFMPKVLLGEEEKFLKECEKDMK